MFILTSLLAMDVIPSLDTVYEAVFTLYHDPNASKKDVASKWLQELQKSVYSWKVADDMLHEKRDLESCYFAAQTMRSKVQLSFHELPTGAHSSLRDSLLVHISQVNMSTNSVIVTQLCLALVDLALQMSSWEKPVIDLINKFSTVNVWPLLEILIVLPEEANSRSLHLGANRREEVRHDLAAAASTVSAFLELCLTNVGDSSQLRTRILRCYTSWVSIKAIQLPECGENIVVAYAYSVLGSHQQASTLHEAATDCLCALLQCLEDNNNQPDLEEKLFANVMALEECFHLSVAHEDQEKSMNYCRIFTELAESFLEKILNQSVMKAHFAIKICDLVLICVGHHDYEVAEITFNLWFRLSEELYQKNNDTVTLMFKPYVERLIAALCKHCQMEPDSEGLAEEGDEFTDFRLKVSELIKDVVFIVGSSNCFRQMFLSIQQPGVTWDSTEAALFIMQAVAKNILPEENEVVPKVVDAILGLPENTHTAVRHTSVQLLGELCEWIEKHPQTLEPVLNFLLHSLQQPQMATVAALSLQNVCIACRCHMGIHLNGLVQIARSLDTFTLSNEAALGLLKGISQIVAKMPPEQIQEAMKDICWCQITPLCALMENGLAGERGSKSDPCLWLDRLSTVFRNINTTVENGAKHPCLDVVCSVLPVLSLACNKFQSDLRVCERLCRCLRFAVRCVPRQIASLVPAVAQQMVALYTTHRFSCFLYLGSILVDEYASDPACVGILYDMLAALLPTTFEILLQPGGLTNHPDTVDDLYRLCARFLQRSPVVFLRGPSTMPVIQCAILACSLDHRDANSSVMKFFYDLIHVGRVDEDCRDADERRSLVKEVMLEIGQPLVTALVTAVVYHLHSYMFSDVADVMREVQLFDKPLWETWLLAAVQTLPHGSLRQATYQQIVDFHTTLAHVDKTKAISHSLRDFVRLYR